MRFFKKKYTYITGILILILVSVMMTAPGYCSVGINETETGAENSTGFRHQKELDSLCSLILKKVTDESMTDKEKAYAVYCWVEKNIKYVSKPDFASWKDGAYDALTTYSGDCYAFYSSLRALLESAGIKCMEGTSVTKDHYWVIAYIDGDWWHIDATPGWGGERFMLTTRELMDFVYYGNRKYSEGLTYDFNPDDYPELKKNEINKNESDDESFLKDKPDAVSSATGKVGRWMNFYAGYGILTVTLPYEEGYNWHMEINPDSTGKVRIVKSGISGNTWFAGIEADSEQGTVILGFYSDDNNTDDILQAEILINDGRITAIKEK